MPGVDGEPERLLRLAQAPARFAGDGERGLVGPSGRTYGAKRIHADWVEAGIRCGLNRVVCLMREDGLRAKTKRRFKVQTTDSHHKLPVAPNLLNQELIAEEKDQI